MKFSFIKPSTREYLKEARKTPNFTLIDILHGYVYMKWTRLYLSMGTGKHPIAKMIIKLINFFKKDNPKVETESKNEDKVSFADKYHAKAIPLETAKKLVMVNEDINVQDLEQVIPYKEARSIILKNPEKIVALECPCRLNQEEPCLPLDVCLIIGDPFASFVMEHQSKKSRWLSKEEAMGILEAENERGHVHHAFFKDVALQRFYAICNCCECCCLAINAHRKGTPMLASSGYIAEIDEALCISCEICAPYCQFEALSMGEFSMSVNYDKCLGCGVCVGHCDHGAISITLDKNKGIPLEISALMDASIQSQMK